MNFIFWITMAFIIIGFIVLARVKRNIEVRESSTIQSTIWLIVGTTGWGVASIVLIMWSLS